MSRPVTQHKPANGKCPDRAVLSELVLGKLPMDSIDKLSSHIESCSTCQGILDTLDGLEDSVVSDLRAAPASGKPDTELEQMLDAAKQIGRSLIGSRVAQATGPTVVDELVGKKLGQYVLLERIGRGGMGTVYKALHDRLKRHVAIKVLPSNRLRDTQAVARFTREMEAIGRLDHPNLVRAHDAGEADGQHYLAMEYLDGIDLSRAVRRRGPLAIADACEAVRQAALGLQYAHEHNLVHRDVKPSNLMLTRDGQIKVLDLGLARLTSDTPLGDEVTGTGQVVGTGDFIAPEQGQDTRHADARSDIYSLGCTLYFLLAGRGPFAGPEYANIVQKVVAHAQKPIPPISQFRSGIPAGLITILDRMLSKNPAQRFQTAAEVADALRPYAAGHDLKDVIVGQGQQRMSDKPAARRHRTWLAASLVLVLIATGLAYWHAELVLIVRGEGVLVVTGDKVAATLAAESANGRAGTLDLDEQGTVRLKAGQYDIRVAGTDTTVVVKPERVEIRRGRKTVVEVIHAAETPRTAALAPPSPAGKPASSQPAETQVANSIGMRFAWIPAGAFLRGSPDNEEGREAVEGPQRTIRLTRPFYLGIHEVTQGQYRRVTGKNPSFYTATGGGAKLGVHGNTDDFPVESVSWEDATAFCQALSALPAEQEAGRRYRLPTEAEWEYACRAGTDTPFYFGKSFSSQQANFKGKYPYGGAPEGPSLGHPVPVGSYQPNAFGLFDMHGNVWEWCQDWHSPEYYVKSPDVDPPGPPSGQRHVIRGGGWGVHSYNCRSAYRCDRVEPREYLFSLGFRAAMERADDRTKGGR